MLILAVGNRLFFASSKEANSWLLSNGNADPRPGVLLEFLYGSEPWQQASGCGLSDTRLNSFHQKSDHLCAPRRHDPRAGGPHSPVTGSAGAGSQLLPAGSAAPVQLAESLIFCLRLLPPNEFLFIRVFNTGRWWLRLCHQ